MNIVCVQPQPLKENFYQKPEEKTKCSLLINSKIWGIRPNEYSKIKKPKLAEKKYRKRLLRKQVRFLQKGNAIFLQIILFVSHSGVGFEKLITLTNLDPSQSLKNGKKLGVAVLTNLVAFKNPLFKGAHHFDEKSPGIMLNELLLN